MKFKSSVIYLFYLASINSPLFCNDDRCLDDALYSQRSLNSRASSNSTSGVVSDKLGSEADKGDFNDFVIWKKLSAISCNNCTNSTHCSRIC